MQARAHQDRLDALADKWEDEAARFALPEDEGGQGNPQRSWYLEYMAGLCRRGLLQARTRP